MTNTTSTTASALAFMASVEMAWLDVIARSSAYDGRDRSNGANFARHRTTFALLVWIFCTHFRAKQFAFEARHRRTKYCAVGVMTPSGCGEGHDEPP
jgi:hypothetical protein